MAKVQRLGRNSVTTLVGRPTDNVPLPEGVILRTEDEMVIWHQFTRTRAVRDWRECDLILLAKIVLVEGDIRKNRLLLDKSGPLLKTDKGTPVANPLIAIIDTWQRQQLALMRNLSISQTETDPRTKNAAGAAAQGFRDLMSDADDLIARPI